MTLLYRQSRSGAALIMHEDKAFGVYCGGGSFLLFSYSSLVQRE